MSKNAGTEFHALVVCLEVPAVFDNLALAVYVASIIHAHTKTAAAARIFPAVAVNVDLHSVRIK